MNSCSFFIYRMDKRCFLSIIEYDFGDKTCLYTRLHIIKWPRKRGYVQLTPFKKLDCTESIKKLCADQCNSHLFHQLLDLICAMLVVNAVFLAHCLDNP